MQNQNPKTTPSLSTGLDLSRLAAKRDARQGISVFTTDEERRELVRHEQWRQALADQLGRMHWDLYATPTFRREVSDGFAVRSAREWISGLGETAFAYIALEQGTLNDRTHVHVLAGGLPRSPRGTTTGLHLRDLAIREAERRWKHGNIMLEAFDPRRGAIRYVSKCPGAGELVGVPQYHKRRRR